MKPLFYFVLFAAILVACNSKGNRAASDNRCDSTVAIADSATKVIKAIPPVIINYTYSRAKTEPVDTCNVVFCRYSDGCTYKDTVINNISVKYICTETTDPEDYMFREYMSTNIYGEVVTVKTVIYGNKASIMWSKSEGNSIKKDTLLITRAMMAETLSQMGIFDKKYTKDFGLADLRFQEVRNDSIIFRMRFGKPDSDVLYELELKFDENSLGKSFTVADITDIWSSDD